MIVTTFLNTIAAYTMDCSRGLVERPVESKETDGLRVFDISKGLTVLSEVVISIIGK